MTPERFSEKVRGDIPYPLLHIPLADLREGQRIAQCFLVKKKTQRSTRTGDPYLEIVLADRTGTIPARAWADATQRYATQFDEGDFVFVDGRTDTYRNVLQIIVESIRRVTAHEQDTGGIPGFDPALLIPTTAMDVDAMWTEILALVDTIEPSPLRDLTRSILTANGDAFREAPAAVFKHHAYVGGLLEHTLEVARGVAKFLDSMPNHGLHRGLAVSGAILHDIGKLNEIENSVAPRFTAGGEFFGHIIQGRDLIHEAAATVEWADERLPLLLEHVLISHHGELEYGAPVLPKAPEAIVVFHFDNLSARLNMIRSIVDTDNEEGDFTAWDSDFRRRFFKGHLEEDAQ